jgi:hypothetical protein
MLSIIVANVTYYVTRVNTYYLKRRNPFPPQIIRYPENFLVIIKLAGREVETGYKLPFNPAREEWRPAYINAVIECFFVVRVAVINNAALASVKLFEQAKAVILRVSAKHKPVARFPAVNTPLP